MAYDTYAEFWPFYLREHSKALTRGLHYVGTSLSILWILSAIFSARPLLLIGALLTGYAFAWVGHFFVEKNRPATFKYPLFSFGSDFKMLFCFLTGRIDAELKKAGVPVGDQAHAPS
jgi:hypothetical protein